MPAEVNACCELWRKTIEVFDSSANTRGIIVARISRKIPKPIDLKIPIKEVVIDKLIQ